MLTDAFPRTTLAHTPTPLEPLPNLTAALGGPEIWIKRDDCTGLAMGGNKVRQLEYYLGDAIVRGSDTIITTGAVQSNHVRTTVAAARKCGIACEVQLEDRVADRPPLYYESGNPLLVRLMGATVHHYPAGDDERAADQALYERADELRRSGRNPYVIPLGADQAPIGALGYVRAAEEIVDQLRRRHQSADALIVPSGSGNTHAGLLAGLRALDDSTMVFGICVRRPRAPQTQRMHTRVGAVAKLINRAGIVRENDIIIDDSPLGPGYGQLTDDVRDAIRLVAENEGILLDPVYTGKTMAGLIHLIRNGTLGAANKVVFLHTGGTPALFGYPDLLSHP